MLILTIRTDKPEAEIGLYQDVARLNYLAWQAHRELSETIHLKIKSLLEAHAKALKDIDGLVVFTGPGSFTGLRIGISVANALSYALNKSIVGTTGDNWKEEGIRRLKTGENQTAVLPEYGAEPHITQPRK